MKSILICNFIYWFYHCWFFSIAR